MNDTDDEIDAIRENVALFSAEFTDRTVEKARSMKDSSEKTMARARTLRNEAQAAEEYASVQAHAADVLMSMATAVTEMFQNFAGRAQAQMEKASAQPATDRPYSTTAEDSRGIRSESIRSRF